MKSKQALIWMVFIPLVILTAFRVYNYHGFVAELDSSRQELIEAHVSNNVPGMQQASERMQAVERKGLIRLDGLAFTVFIYFVLIVSYFIYRLIHPIEFVTKNLEDISQGRFDINVRGKERTDELGDLARAFDRTLTSLKLAMKTTAPQLLKESETLKKLLAEKNAAESRLREKEQQLTLAQQIAHLGSWEWDIPSDTVTWSDELYRIYGLKPQELKATYEGFLERVHPDDRVAVRSAVSDSYRTGKPFEFMHRIVRPDGTVRVLRAHGSVMLDNQGKALKMIGTGQDVTEQQSASQGTGARITLP